MTPKHSIDFCPICGGGLCGIRVCGLQEEPESQDPSPVHGLIVCDECEAIWVQPDTTSDHQYPNAVDARCPICNDPLWGKNSRWAVQADVDALSWQDAVNHELDS